MDPVRLIQKMTELDNLLLEPVSLLREQLQHCFPFCFIYQMIVTLFNCESDLFLKEILITLLLQLQEIPFK